MSRLSCYLLQFLLLLVFSISALGCDGGLVAPNPGEKPQVAPVTGSANHIIKITKPIHQKPGLAILPNTQVDTQSAQDLLEALNHLRDLGGGVTTVQSLPSDQFVVNVWDKNIKANLTAQVAIVSGGMASIQPVNGYAIFRICYFPGNGYGLCPGLCA